MPRHASSPLFNGLPLTATLPQQAHGSDTSRGALAAAQGAAHRPTTRLKNHTPLHQRHAKKQCVQTLHGTGGQREPGSLFPPAPHNCHSRSKESNATLKQTWLGCYPKPQCAFENSMTHGNLQFTLSIAPCCVLHRCTSQEIHRLKLFLYLLIAFLCSLKESKENGFSFSL